MLDEFYSIRGWTKEGKPKLEKLAELGLTEYAKKIGLT
ncbi:MAG: aldehyde ferredoxin oxidoreductase C-terminal domain-containing protein [Nitrososphaerota archaeon]